MLRIRILLCAIFLCTLQIQAVEVAPPDGSTIQYHSTISVTNPVNGDWYRVIICDTFNNPLDSIDFQYSGTYPNYSDQLASGNHIGYGTYRFKVKTATTAAGLSAASAGTGKQITLAWLGKVHPVHCGHQALRYQTPLNVLHGNSLSHLGYRAYFYDNVNDTCIGYLEHLAPYTGSWSYNHQLTKCSGGSGGFLSFNTTYKVVVEASDQLGNWHAGDTCTINLVFNQGLHHAQCDKLNLNYGTNVNPVGASAVWYSAHIVKYYDSNGICVGQHYFVNPQSPIPDFDDQLYVCGDTTTLGGYLNIQEVYDVVVTARDFNGNWMESQDTCVVGFHGCSLMDLSGSVTHPSCGSSNGSIDLTTINGTAPFSFNWSNSATTEDISGLTPGTYTVTVTDHNGCLDSLSFTLTNTGLAANITAVIPDITLSVALNSGATVSWSNNQNGTTYSTASIDVAMNGAEWTAVVSDTICGNDTVCYSVPDLTGYSGICGTSMMIIPNDILTIQAEENEPVQVFPNPTEGSLNISLPDSWETYQYQLTSISGQLVKSAGQEWNSGLQTINLSDVTAGMYILTIHGNMGKSFVQKIRVE